MQLTSDFDEVALQHTRHMT